MQNSVFMLSMMAHPRDSSTKLYYFTVWPLVGADPRHVDLLGDSLAMICNVATGEKSSIILDCSVLTSGDFRKMSLVRALAIDAHTGLDRLLIVTSSEFIKMMTNGIIALKKASSYAKVCLSSEEALLEL